MKKERVIDIAKKYLLNNPFDIAHDIFHHHKVWENALFIVIKEDLSLDLDKVEIAAWWHDYERGSSEHQSLVNAMLETGYERSYIDSVKDLINSHSYTDKRLDTEEAKVLFDADKLEYVNSGRLVWVGEGVGRGLLDPEVGRKYGAALQERIFNVVKALHYPSTRSIMIDNLTRFMANLPMLKGRYKEFLSDVKEDEFIKALTYLKSM